MGNIGEARRRKVTEVEVDVDFSPIWRSDMRTTKFNKSDITTRVEEIISHSKFGTRLRGKGKASALPYLNVLHSHVYEQKLDPLIMYRLYPAEQGRNAFLLFLALTTHTEAFRGNAETFYAKISGYMEEGRVFLSMRDAMDAAAFLKLA